MRLLLHPESLPANKEINGNSVSEIVKKLSLKYSWHTVSYNIDYYRHVPKEYGANIIQNILSIWEF